jgi:tricorn protease
MGFEASFSPDGTRLAYMPPTCFRSVEEVSRWADDKDMAGEALRLERREIPRQNSNDFNPMWVGSKVYFLSIETAA